ncbi:MAG: methylmalonyl-CoA epimerase [Candidatus Alcyoniella australis]|nr:methylmalonyl-CoA epimerase [Candidatus Alcyoniella australis]
MIKRISHLGIATPSIEAARKLYEDLLGLKVEHSEDIAAQKVRTAFLPVGEVNIELLEPLSSEGAIAKYLEKNGRGGMHHICFEVDDIDAELERLKQAGVPLIDEQARAGAHGARVAFLHPKGTHGVLIELAQHPED